MTHDLPSSFALRACPSMSRLPSSLHSRWATWNYEYGPDEYVTVAKGISPDGKIAITAHGSGELGDEHFHLYLTDAGTGKKIGPLKAISYRITGRRAQKIKGP